MEEGPRRFVEKGDFRRLKGLYYRFQKDSDIILLFESLRKIYRDFGGMGRDAQGILSGRYPRGPLESRASTFFTTAMP